jgi:hypothetical protein
MIYTNSEYHLGEMIVRYLLDEENGHIGIQLFPSSQLGKLVKHRTDLSGVKELATIAEPLSLSLQSWGVQPLVEFSLTEDVKGNNLGRDKPFAAVQQA